MVMEVIIFLLTCLFFALLLLFNEINKIRENKILYCIKVIIVACEIILLYTIFKSIQLWVLIN